MAYVPATSPPISKQIDFASLVAALDPELRLPTVVYIEPNGRKFKEYPKSDPAPKGYYSSEDHTALYASSYPPLTFYAVE